MRKIEYRSARILLVVMAVMALLAFGVPVLAQAPDPSPSPITANMTSPIPPEVTQYAKDWPLPGKDYSNTRATTDSSINSSNVNSLGIAWTVDIKGVGPFGGVASPPIIMGDTVYFQDLAYNIYSVDFKTGKVNWMNEYNTPWQGPNGVSVGWGKVFGSLGYYSLGALDMKTGEKMWETNMTNPEIGFKYLYNNIPPIPYDGLVYTANSPHVTYNVGGMAGYIYAMEQDTGTVIWSFNTVTDDFWGHPELNSGGGCWQPPSVDLETGLMFWGTANPGQGIGPRGPYGGTKEFPNGASRPGNNLYTNCILAMNHLSGKLEWYQQPFPHDLVDHDFMNPPILAEAKVGNITVPLAVGSGKAGVVIAYDRNTGGVLWSTPVGEHNGYDRVTVLPDTPTAILPGLLGGVETPMAYGHGMIYAPYDDWAFYYSALGESGAVAPISEATGGLAAIDVNTGNITWDVKLPSLTIGGATVVNDLVFTATYAGMIYAFDAVTGKQVFSFKAPAGINSWPGVAGDTIVWGAGVGKPVLMALKLGAGNATPALTPTPYG